MARVQVDSYRSAYANSFPQTYLDHFTYEEQELDWIDWLNQGTREILLVALSAEEQVVGYVLARAQAEIHPGYDSEILALHVQKTVQRQGIGSALLRAAAEQLVKQGCQTTMLWTLQKNPVRRWYESLQGQFLGEKSYEVESWEIVEVAYGWEKISTLLEKLR
jgi:ribosomal protein S18 acetylase RimI-like enzyme